MSLAIAGVRGVQEPTKDSSRLGHVVNHCAAVSSDNIAFFKRLQGKCSETGTRDFGRPYSDSVVAKLGRITFANISSTGSCYQRQLRVRGDEEEEVDGARASTSSTHVVGHDTARRQEERVGRTMNSQGFYQPAQSGEFVRAVNYG